MRFFCFLCKVNRKIMHSANIYQGAVFEVQKYSIFHSTFTSQSKASFFRTLGIINIAVKSKSLHMIVITCPFLEGHSLM